VRTPTIVILLLTVLSAPQFERSARAFGDGDKLSFGIIAYRGRYSSRPNALRRLAWEIEKRTSIETASPEEVHLSNEAELRRHPFLYLAGDGPMALPDEADLGRLRSHLQAGGFLLIDGAGETGGALAFDRSVRTLLGVLFPKEHLERIPADHVLFRSFYLVQEPVGRVARVPYAEGVTHDGRLLVVYVQNDLGGAYTRDELGRYDNEVHPGGERQRELSFRFGINLAMYALCLDYKTDQVHVPFILRRRRWQGAPQ
jgi:hypothetical protein